LLDEYKELYRQSADRIKNWKDISKNELCVKYIENENEHPEIAQDYLGALVCRYWGLIAKFYASSYNVAIEEDVYEWLIDSILYTLKHRRWEDKNSTIYQDPNGPDKMINRCMKSRRLTYYQTINRQKRKGGFNSISLDKIIEEVEDNSYIFEDKFYEDLQNRNLELINFVRDTFYHKDYFAAYLIYFIAYGNVFILKEDNKPEFNTCRLGKYFRNLNEDFIKSFSREYDIEPEKIRKSFKYVGNLSYTDVQNKIEFNLERLKHNKIFKGVLI